MSSNKTPDELLEVFQELTMLTNSRKELVLGGSLGIYLHGYLLPRPLKDLDISFLDTTQPLDEFIANLEWELQLSSSDDLLSSDDADLRSMSDFQNGLKFKDVWCEFREEEKDCMEYVEILYKGWMYQVEDLTSILLWKSRYANRRGTPSGEKHYKDLQYLRSVGAYG
jgi:hypothetical protein